MAQAKPFSSAADPVGEDADPVEEGADPASEEAEAVDLVRDYGSERTAAETAER